MFAFSQEDEEFRAEVRSFIDKNLDPDVRERLQMGNFPEKHDVVEWTQKLHARGWAVPSWPVEWGGPGWTLAQRVIFREEIAAAPAPEPQVFNVGMLGPVLIAFGTEEQKRNFLPRVAKLDLWFCQGFSEPGAGSDLASLKTRAVRDGDDYIVNGQKIWTSHAGEADWMFALVRTDTSGKPQTGISFLLIDMKTPGIGIRQLEMISGSGELYEVFFDDVRVPATNLVGQEGQGWTYAKYLLGHERTGMARVPESLRRVSHARAMATQSTINGQPMSEDPLFGIQAATLEAELVALQALQYRTVFGPESEDERSRAVFASLLKLKGSELLQRTASLVAEVAGPRGMAVPDQSGDDWRTGAGAAALHSRSATIYGGASEIQKTILAKALGL